MKTQTSVSGIKKEFGNIVVAQVLPPVNGAKKAAAQLKQEVKTIYPTGKATSSKADALFANEDFGFADGQSYTSTRTTLLSVPIGTTVEKVQALVDMNENAVLVKYISNDIMDVLTDEQVQAVNAGLQTIGDFKAKLQVKDKDGNPIIGKDGEIEVIYQQHFFRKEYTADVDKRQAVTLEESAPAKRLTSLNSLVGA